MPNGEKKGITVRIDADLHAKVSQYLRDHSMTMAEFVSLALDDELHPKNQMKEGNTIQGNLEKAKRYTEYALKCGTAPVVPHFYALCLNDDIPIEREIGLSAGMSLLWFCDELWIFGDEITEGMRREIDFCKNLNIKTRAVKDSDIKKVLGG